MANISDYITPVSNLQYYVCMIDFGRGRARPQGFGADVCPEYTRRQTVEEVRENIESGRKIVHVKLITGNDVKDVTHDIIAEALAVQADIDAENDALDREFERDHVRGLRKNEVA
jgi:hypothetical protein